MKLRLITLGLILISVPVNATNLADAIDIAKSNNRSIKAEDYKFEASKSLKSEARAAFLPSLSASGQYGERKSNTGAKAGQYNSNQVEELKVEQPLFDGFGSVARYNEADYKVQSASKQNHSKKQEIALEVVQAYCELFRQDEMVKIQQENVAIFEEIFELVQNRKKKKFIDESDIIKFSYDLENARTKRFESDSKLLKAKFQYRNLVGDLHENLTMPAIKIEKFDEKKTVEIALANNHKLRSSYFNYLASKSAYSAQKSAFAPSVSMVGSVSRQKNPIYLNGQDFVNRSVYVNVSVPIFQKGVEYSNLEKASNQSSAAREEFEAEKSELIKNVGQAIQEYNFYLKLNSSNQELFDLAQSRVEILTKRFEAGAEDVIELLRAKADFNNRKAELLDARLSLVATHYRIKFLIGEI